MQHQLAQGSLPSPLVLAQLMSTVTVPGQAYLALSLSTALSFCHGQQDSSPGFHNTLTQQRLTAQGQCQGKEQWDGWGDGKDEGALWSPRQGTVSPAQAQGAQSREHGSPDLWRH